MFGPECLKRITNDSATGTTWKKIFYVASVPCLALTMYTAYVDHKDHQYVILGFFSS